MIISEYIHHYIAKLLHRHRIKTVVDIGGTGKMRGRGFQHFDANKRRGFDGQNLRFKDNTFDASMSVATIEHVNFPIKFISESVRVARKISVHWYPSGEDARRTEKFKRDLGHNHPCKIPDDHGIDHFLNESKMVDLFNYSPLITIAEHLFALATEYSKLNRQKIFTFVSLNKTKYYGVLLIIKK